MNEPTYKLEKLDFDGPLDLLLRLIAKNRIDIYDIPIVELTRQYMEYVRMMEEKDLDIVSDFLVMAATLLEIKSRMLLPSESDESGEEEDPRTALVERLLEYRRIKFISGELLKYEEYAERYLYREQDIPDEVRSYERPVDLDGLLAGVTAAKLESIFIEVLKRKEYKEDTRHSGFGVIRKERIPLTERIGSLIGFARKKRRFSFRELLESGNSREDIVVSFLAVLELMKTGTLRAEQNVTCGDIELFASDGIGEGLPDLSAVIDD